MKKNFWVTDHAMLRYLERILEIDLKVIRKKLEAKLEPMVRAGARSVTADGVCFQVAENADSIVIATVLSSEMKSRLKQGTSDRAKQRRYGRA